ncbi:MAG: hypothetical protein J6K89_03350, partial [Oscillospiraceae bacterium]|nr:hypothetical protein [Oscillospiraceae bacterium]
KDQSENSIIKIEDLGENYADGYQDLDQDQPYGNDSSYTDLTEGYVGSGGNSKKITVTGKGEVLRFDFKGTGFDLIGSTTADSGSLIYAVYQVAPGAEETKDDLILRSTLNTAYKVSGGAIYEVPLIHVMDLPHDDYRVIITSVPKYDWSSPTDSNGIPTKMVPVYLYLDGVRIYDPIATDDKENREHYNAGERTAQFIQLRNMILEGQAAAAKITPDGKFTFGSGLVSYVQSSPDEKWYTGNNVSSLNQYLTAGPNNEVYFNENTQTLVLYAREIQPGENGALNPATMLQIAIRNLNPEANYDKDETAKAPAFAVLGKTEVHDLCVEDSPISYTEQYYRINLSDCVTEEIGGKTYYRVLISARNSSAFSLTNLKYSNLEFYTIPASASTYKYNSNGELIETNNPNATEMPNLQQLAWQLLAANGMLPEDTDRPEDSTKALTFRSISLSLQSSIGMNFYVADETLKGYTDPYVVVTKTRYDSAGNVVEANAVTETLKEFQRLTAAGEACHMFHFSNIAAKEMNSTITLTLWATKDGEKVEGETRTYSVVQYAQNMLEKTQDVKLKTLLVDMLNYGAAAQIYFNYNNSEKTLANASEEIQAAQSFATVAAPEVKSYITSSTTNGDQLIQMEVGISNVSLSLEDRVEANFYMQDMAETQDLSKVTLVVAYEDITGNVVQQQIKGTDFTQVKDTTGRTLYKAIFNKLNATEMRSIMNVWVVDESGMRISNAITYSVESYAATMKDKEGASATLKSLLVALMKYGDAAEAYFHALAASGSAS